MDSVLAEVSAYSTASMNDDDKVLIVIKVTADNDAAEEDNKTLIAPAKISTLDLIRVISVISGKFLFFSVPPCLSGRCCVYFSSITSSCSFPI